jgi:hypothetical protein
MKAEQTLILLMLLCGALAACKPTEPYYLNCRDSRNIIAAIAPETDPDITKALEAFVNTSAKQDRKAAIATLVKFGSRSIIPMFSLRKSSCYWGNHLIEGMHEVSKQVGAPAVPKLIEILKMSDPNSYQMFTVAAEALGQIGASAMPQLIPLLKDQNVQVRLNATESLGQIGKPAIPQLVAISKQDSDPKVRILASELLKGLKTSSK